ncbi:TPA: J domain-containing protein [Candidatus Poribacteria bacterium]|nr:J domain-containing protein [Candidatus Poribacteria bacterium]HIO48658.1 J domain-containing protein [Candidatus Poribacteria bacterium]
MPDTALVFTKNRDQVKIEELQLDLQAKRQQVAEMTLDLEDLKLEMRHFQKEYNLRVAGTYVELDRVNLSMKEYRLRLRLIREGVCRAEIEERVVSCFKSERQRLENYERDAMEHEKESGEDSNRQKLSIRQAKQIRKLYLELAKIYHPDKSAGGEQDYERQKQMMTIINRAYEDQDIDTLKRMSVESVDEIELHNQTFSEKKKQLTQQLNCVMRSVGDLRLEINRIKSGEIYQLKREVSKTREKGVDLIANLVKDIQRRVNANQRKLTDLISIFQQLSARSQPMD